MINRRNNLIENGRRGIATIPVVAACCGLATAVALGLWTVERSRVRALDQERIQTAAALDQAKLQIEDLGNRLKTLAQKSAETPATVPLPLRRVLLPQPAGRSRSAPFQSVPVWTGCKGN